MCAMKFLRMAQLHSFFRFCGMLVLTFHSHGYVAETFATYRSLDNGRSWEKSGTGLPRLARVNGFGTNGAAVLAATDQGIFISRDQGQGWIQSDSTNLPRALCFASTGPTVFAGTAGAGLLVSDD